MRISAFCAVALLSMGAFACSKSTTADPPKAEILDTPAATASATVTASAAVTGSAAAAMPSATASGTAAAAAPEVVALTAANTTIGFTGSKVGGSHNGTFGKVTGQIKLNAKIEESEISIEIDVASLRTDSTKLDEHLKSEDFFDVKKFAKSTFKSTVIVAEAGKPDTYSVTGVMEIKGVRKTLKFSSKIERKDGGGVTVKARFIIGRKGFHVDSDGLTDYLIKDEVGLSIAIK
jgi:polyisoprenoid-binding protein YceI